MSLKLVVNKISSQKSHWIRGFLIGLAISILVSILAYLGHFRPYENPITSVLQQVLGKKSNDIVLLFITEDEYKKGFNGHSPLSRERLSRLVDVLVKLKAKVIAFDIDFSDKTNEDDLFIDAIKYAQSKDIPVVLPSILKPLYKLGDQKEVYSKLHPYLPDEYEKNKDGYLLFSSSSLQKELTKTVMQGGSLFTLDKDGVFRNGKVFYYSVKEDSTKIIPSFPLAIAAAYHGISEQNLDLSLEKKHDHNIELMVPSGHEAINIHYGDKGKITPNFLGNYEHFQRIIDLETLLETYGGDDHSGKTIIEDKIVIVGGVYDKNDFYRTPVGRMSGMEIIANITQNISDHNLISHLSFWKAFIFEVLLGAVVALFFILFSPVKAAIYCLISLIPLTIVSSLIAFSSTYYWFDFIPTIAGVMLHGVISKIESKAHANL